MHKTFEAEIPRLSDRARTRHGFFFARLGHVSQEYTLLQISKLHDPAVQQRSINLSLSFVMDFGGWDDSTRAELLRLKTTLDRLGRSALAEARNKAICHADLSAILTAQPISTFPSGLDDEYFTSLRQFACIVHEKIVGSIWVFGDEAAIDVRDLVLRLNEAANR